MSLLTIAWKSIRQRALASSLTAVSVALGVMLMVSVLVVNGVVERVFNQSSTGYDLIVGAKGSPLQLVLNTLYYLSTPVENIPYTYYKELKANPRIEHAIPFCMGDVTPEGNFKIVGTTDEFFEVPYAVKRKFAIKGDILRDDFDAVIGWHVARTLDWKLGSTFQPAHGVADSDHIHHETFKVVGILAPTGTPHDKAVFVHIDGFYQIAGHAKPEEEAAAKAKEYQQFLQDRGNAPPADLPAEADQGTDAAAASGAAATAESGEAKADAHDHDEHDHAGHDHHHHELPDEQKEVTAVLVVAQHKMLAIQLHASINDGPYAQSAIPFQQIYWLLTNVTGNIRTLLVVMTGLIIAVSGIGIFVSIYNSMADRQKEIATMRALGARRSTVFTIILVESVLLCVGGGILGILLGHGLVFVARPIVEMQTGLLINPWSFEVLELVLIPVLIGLASLIGIVPGIRAYQTDVAQALQS